jgi:cell division protease FtsH
MSHALGPIVLGQKDSQPFLGRDLGHQADYSGQVAFRIDEEIRGLIDEAHDEALEILVENADVLDALAEKLLEVETVEGALLAEVFAPIRKRADRGLPVPDHTDPARVISTLRRTAASNGHAPSAGNGLGAPVPDAAHDAG